MAPLAKRFLGRLDCFFIWFGIFELSPLAVELAPRAFWSIRAENLLFFLPQLMIPRFVSITAEGRLANWVDNHWSMLCAGYWSVVAITFCWSTRRLRQRTAFLLAGPTILLSTVALNWLLYALGLEAGLDGP